MVKSQQAEPSYQSARTVLGSVVREIQGLGLDGGLAKEIVTQAAGKYYDNDIRYDSRMKGLIGCNAVRAAVRMRYKGASVCPEQVSGIVSSALVRCVLIEKVMPYSMHIKGLNAKRNRMNAKRLARGLTKDEQGELEAVTTAINDFLGYLAAPKPAEVRKVELLQRELQRDTNRLKEEFRLTF